MPNQSDFERISRIVVLPLLAAYGGTMTDGMIEAFVEDLCRYGNDTLAAAVREVRRSCKRMPTVAHLVEACREVAPATQPQEPARPFPWVERQAAANRMAREAMAEFQSTRTAVQALAEGWWTKLHAFAWDAIAYQAGLICGVRNCGYTNAAVAWDAPHASAPTIRARRAEFEAHCRAQAAVGSIDVLVPPEAIAHWRASAQRRAARAL